MISIIGGGVSGLTLAGLLVQKGFKVTLFERTPHLKESKKAPLLLTNGAILLKKELNIQSLGDLSTRLNHMNFSSPLGFDYGTVELKKKLQSWGVYDDFGLIFRDDLVNVLASKVPNESIKFGHTFEKFKQDKDGVTIYFKEGHTVRSDLLIGCDGIHSTVRKQLLGPGHPHYSGLGLWYGLSNYEFPHRDGDINFRQDSNYSLSYFGCGKNAKETVVLCIHKSSNELPESWQFGDLESSKKEVLEILKDNGEPIPQIVQAASKFGHYGLHFHEPITNAWHRGRVALLGDACHPTIPIFDGQGANLGIEDAVSLTHLLEEHQHSFAGIETAFVKYYEQRAHPTEQTIEEVYSKAKSVTSNSWIKNASTLASLRSGGAARAFKNTILGSTSSSLVREALK